MKSSASGRPAPFRRLAGLFLIILLAACCAPLTAAVITDVTLSGNGASGGATVAASGQYVAFDSFATNLVTPATSTQQIFNFDRLATSNAITQVSKSASGVPALGQSLNATICGDGTSTIFDTASQLVTTDTDNKQDVYRRTSSATVRISVKTGGGQATPPSASTGKSQYGRPSSTGNVVTFVSSMYNLGGPNNGSFYGYVRDVTGNTTTVISTSLSTTDPVAISPDGAYIALRSGTSIYVYAYNNTAHTCTLAQTYTNSASAASLSNPAANGKYYITFASSGNVVTAPLDTASVTAVAAGTTPVISADARFVAYQSGNDVKITKLGGSTVTINGVSGDTLLPALNAEGRWVAFQSLSTALVTGDTNGQRDVFLADIAAFKPDVQIANASDGVYVGDNVYNADGTSQTKAQSIFTPETAVYYLKLQNDEPSYQDKFKVTGTAQSGGWTVNYFDAKTGGANITSAVTSTGGWVSPYILATQFIEIRVEVTGSKNCRPSPALKDLLITATSVENTTGTPIADTVKASTTWTNSPPVAVDDGPYNVDENAASMTIAAPGVKGNDSDVDGDALSISVVTDVQHGTLTLNQDGSFTFYPATNYSGPDSFQYKLNDGLLDSNVATVSITMNPIDEPPTFTKGGDITIDENNSVPYSQAGWATGITDGLGVDEVDVWHNVLAFTVTPADPSLFAVQPAIDPATGTLTFTTTPYAYGSTSCSVTLTDGTFTVGPQSFTITLTPINEPPTFTAGGDVATDENVAYSAVWATGITKGLGTDEDVIFGDVLAFTVTPANATLFASGGAPAIDPGTGVLTFTPKTNTVGDTDVTVSLSDGTNTVGPVTFHLTITPVNEPPTFTAGSDVTTDENVAYSAIWATDMSKGLGVDEDTVFGDVLAFAVTPANATLFAAGGAPAIDAGTGVLTFTPKANTVGATTCQVTLTDGTNTTAPVTFTLTILAVNEPPTFTIAGDVTTDEDVAFTGAGWATGITPGLGADDATDPLTFTLTPDDPTLFDVLPAVDPGTGTLTFTPAAHASGATMVAIELSDGVNTAGPEYFTITVTPVNEPPSFTPGADAVTSENVAFSQAGWATDISKGLGVDDDTDVLTFTLVPDDPTLFAMQPAVDPADGTLSFTPATDASGATMCSITLDDGYNTTAVVWFMITINPVDEPPTFTVGSDVTVDENSGAFTQAGWASGITKGLGADEDAYWGDILTFTVTPADGSLFAVAPDVSADGTLTFTPAANASGATLCDISLSDGYNSTGVSTFTITLSPVNEPPSFIPGSDVTTDENVAFSAVWATGITKGLGADDDSDVLTFTVTPVNATLFDVLPAIDPATGVLSFTPKANTVGDTDCDVTLSDGVNTTTPVTFKITIAPVNEPPSFTAGADVSTNENVAFSQAGWATAISKGLGVDDDADVLTFTVTPADPGLFDVAPAVTDTGTLTFTPKANTAGSTSCAISLSDGTYSTAAQTFNITIVAVNEPPTFTKGPDVSTNENVAFSQAAWATGITKGLGVDDDADVLTFTLTPDDASLFATGGAPAVDPGTGDLTFTPKANTVGETNCSISLSDGANTVGPEIFHITIVAVNEPPTFTKGADVETNQNVAFSQAGWATGITKGLGADDDSDVLIFTVTPADASLFADGGAPTIDPADGTLSFVPKTNVWGVTTCDVTLSDGVNTTAAQTFTLTIVSTNDPPTFTAGGDVRVQQDSGAYTQTGWATGITKGIGADDDTDVLTFTATPADPALFAAGPAISDTGTLTFTPETGAYGSTLVSVTLSDGFHTVGPQNFTITINAKPIPTDATLVTSLGVVKSGTLGVTDPDNSTPYTFAIATQGTKGTAAITDAATGAFTYTPLAAATVGTDSFTFTVTDSYGASGTGTITVDLHAKLTVVTLYTSAASPASAGTAVTLTAAATGGGVVEYAFKVVDAISGADVVPQTAYSSSNTYLWDTGSTGGSYTLYAYAREADGGTPRSANKAFTITDGTLTSLTLAPSIASPLTAPGSPVTLTTTVYGSEPSYEYKYKIVNSATGSVVVQTAYTAGASSYVWTSTSAVGAYSIYAYARVDSAHYELSTVIPYSITSPELTKVTLTASVPSPQVTGTTITFTGTPTPVTPVGVVQYQYTITRGATVIASQPYSDEATFVWDTAGLAVGYYTVKLQARPVDNITSVQTVATSYLLVYSTLTGVTVTTDKTSPQPVGTAVTFTATATPAPAPGSVEYMFMVLNAAGVVVRQTSYVTSPNTYAWDTSLPPGTYTVRAYVRPYPTRDYELIASKAFSFSALSLSGVAIAASPTSPSLPPVTFTATATPTPAPGEIEYQFLVRNPVTNAIITQTAFSTSNTYAWDTALPAGNYRVAVNARPVDLPSYVLTATMAYFIKDPALTSVALTTSLASPQVLGATIGLVATATPAQPNPPPTPAVVEYQFKFLRGTTAVLTDWQTSPTLSWNTSLFGSGIWTLTVNARLAATPTYVIASAAKAFTIQEAYLTGIAVGTSVASGQTVGTPVTILANKTPAGTPGETDVEYQYAIRLGTTEFIRTAWTTDPAYLWDTTGRAAGTYVLLVYARPAASGSYTLIASKAFVLK